jgi:hypothetical protein
VRRNAKRSWQGSSSGRGRIGLAILAATVAAFLLVPVAQAAAAGTLTLTITGTGSGEVRSSNAIDETHPGSPEMACSYASPGPATGVCENEMTENETNLSSSENAFAAPAPGSEFAGWTVEEGEEFFPCTNEELQQFYLEELGVARCIIGAENGANARLKAVFNVAAPAGPTLTLNIEEGSGTVVSNPAGIECTGTAPTSCEAGFAENELVTLTASPAAGNLFKSWKGCETVNGRQCTVKMSASRSVGAKFVPTKNVKVNVVGQGSVKSKPGGIACLPACSSMTAAFAEGSTVELVQAPSKHFVFAGWSGDCSGTGSCSLTMGANKEVTATFTEVPQKTLTLTKSGGGTALIKTKPTGVNCGYTCPANSASFYEGGLVEVAWKLNKGTTSIEWTSGAGTCTGKSTALEGTCTLTIGASNVSLNAKLE